MYKKNHLTKFNLELLLIKIIISKIYTFFTVIYENENKGHA